MRITKQILQNAKDAIRYFEANPENNAYIQYAKDTKFIEFIVQKDSYYYGTGFTYFEGSIFGFTFSKDLFEEDEKTV